MKTTRIFIAAFAAALSLVSCTKENADQKNSSSTSEPRVFTLEFSKQTRTTLGSDGLTPEWTNGDKIWISNDQSGEEVSVTVSGDKATITTTLKGTLKAVYPSSAVVKDGSGVISDFSVPATQHGTFAESNICMATDIAADAETIIFVNKTAVLCFYVDESIGVSKIEIEGDGVATGGNKITVDPLSPKSTLYEVGGGPDPRICYAAVLPVSGKQIKLTGTATSQTQPRTIPPATLEASKIYNAFIPYYIDLGDAGKWGYCNVGAFLPEEYGDYFAWGEIEGHKYENGNWTFPSSNPDSDRYTGTWNASSGFAKCNTPYSLRSYYSKYPDGNTLELSDDAANVQWRGSWRMPTRAEFNALKTLDTKGWQTNYNSSGVNGYTFSDGSNTVFFPAAGYGNGTELLSAGSDGYYWSSSLGSEYPTEACRLYFSGSGVNSYDDLRINGYSVRPLSE